MQVYVNTAWYCLLVLAIEPTPVVVSFVLRGTPRSADHARDYANIADPGTAGIRLPWILDTKEFGPYQQERDWGFAYSSVEPEQACTSYVIKDVEGELPADLKGTYYKIGPGNFERGGKDYEHFLDGDGFVAAFHFDGEDVTYTGRFVESEYFLEEQNDDAIKYRSVFGTQRPQWFKNVLDLELKNVANTNIVAWGGRLLALFEAGIPYELDPQTLETMPKQPHHISPYTEAGTNCGLARGVTLDQGGPVDQLLGTTGKYFTAHPHVVDDDTMVAFVSTTNVRTSLTQMEFVEYDRDWQLKRTVPSSPFKGTAPHDFAVSDNHYVFFQNPFADVDSMSYLLGLKGPAQSCQISPRQPTILQVVNRDTAATMQIALPSYFNIHTVSKAQETKDGKLTLLSSGWDLTDERFFPQTEDSVALLGNWGGRYPDFDSGAAPPNYLFRTIVDLETGTVVSHEQVALGHVVEFPMQDEQDDAVYCSISATNDVALPGTGFCRYNADDSIDYWWAPHRVFTGELNPIPKENSPGSWLVGTLHDAGRKRTSLAIFDSERFTDGPVCQLHLMHHVTYGIHGEFAKSSLLASGDPRQEQ